MIWSLRDSLVVGGMEPFDGAAPFARADVVLRRGGDEYLRVRRYLADQAEGTLLTVPDWEGLVSAEEALRLPSPVAVRPGAALWVIRRGFGPDRRRADAELRARDPDLNMEAGGDDARAYVVNEPDVGMLRVEWASRSFNETWQALKAGDLDSAQRAAERAFVLKGMDPDHVALLALVWDKRGDKAQSEVYLGMARRSRGEEFYRCARGKMNDLLRDLATATTRRPRFDPSFWQDRVKPMEIQLRRLKDVA